ncbi:hypothetical protein TIFTF001_030264 [Ficus carica]|uniref:Uncharacterized protein n=1 Tax=Ficus carica TaxID=3494 RepID=A0AA88DT14_FICCA|nr:hypothetical protein TIFTF001_030264 [Ficus carica]
MVAVLLIALLIARSVVPSRVHNKICHRTVEIKGLINIARQTSFNTRRVVFKLMSSHSRKNLGFPKGVVVALKYNGDRSKILEQGKRRKWYSWSLRWRILELMKKPLTGVRALIPR